MERAIRLSRYYLNHAQAAYSVLPDNAVAVPGEKILNVIRDKKLEGFDRRDMMRSCRAFKTVAEIQPVLDSLEDYGYIARQPEKPSVTGRPPLPKYLVNPKVHEMICSCYAMLLIYVLKLSTVCSQTDLESDYVKRF